MMEYVLVTGAAGFIGFHVSRALLERGYQVHGVDNLNEYYDVQLKKDRLTLLEQIAGFSFSALDITDRRGMERLFADNRFDRVIHLAAQAGVRYSVTNPHVYISSNIEGFLHVLEGCRHNGVKHLVYASSSSVYGANTRMPFAENDNVDHPVSLYAATKKANELMAHSYASLYGLPCTGLRFFTVYGPWGRPDMALFLFTKAILEGKDIEVFNNGIMKRDFTYIDDIVDGVIRLMVKIPQSNLTWCGSKPDPATSYAPYRIYNIGNNSPVELLVLIGLLEDNLSKKANIVFKPLQPGDVIETFANIEDIASHVGFRPYTNIDCGIKQFINWYKTYFNS
jgi:UDP-glucuronate 4-epimerase